MRINALKCFPSGIKILRSLKNLFDLRMRKVITKKLFRRCRIRKVSNKSTIKDFTFVV